ncbi:MAG: hypothetical protein OXC95_12045 [Dehalococcoidia bacterium]|nr:hypothetical protein [Dehalococcoidia bacterium]
MVRANPEPYDLTTADNSQGPIVYIHSDRIHWASASHTFEVQTWVSVI